jgi:hypothetical protein
MTAERIATFSINMPECQAKFCTVVRGKGISTFSIPDPKKKL